MKEPERYFFFTPRGISLTYYSPFLNLIKVEISTKKKFAYLTLFFVFLAVFYVSGLLSSTNELAK